MVQGEGPTETLRTVGGHSHTVAEMVEQDKYLTERPDRKNLPRLYCSPTRGEANR